MYPKRTEFIASYLEVTCVYYILLDNIDLQSCQVGQGKDVAITTPVQSTLCTLGHQAVPRLASCLHSMWHNSTRGFRSEKNSLISVLVQIAWQCFQRSTWNLLPRVTTNWGFKYTSPEQNFEAFRPKYKPMKPQLSVPELSTSTPYVGDNEGLGMVLTGLKWSQIKITAQPANN